MKIRIFMGLVVIALVSNVFILSCKKDKQDPPVVTPPADTSFSTTPISITLPAGFPPLETPPNNPLTEEGVELGRYLFYDENIMCVNCHDRNQSFTAPGAFPVQVNGKTYNRNPMPFINLAWVQGFAWDGRSDSLEKKIISSVAESVNIPYATLIPLLESSTKADYSNMFKDAFGTTTINQDRINKALAQFLRIMISANSRGHQYMNGDESALTTIEKDGFEIFSTETGNCSHCHLHTNKLFTDNTFRNNGLDSVTDVADFDDYGYGEVTGIGFDNGKFRSVSLINIELSGPYMHDARFNTLEEVIEHYNKGGVFSPNVDNVINETGTGLNLTQYQKDALIAFLKSLTDTTFIYDPDYDDPFVQ